MSVCVKKQQHIVQKLEENSALAAEELIVLYLVYVVTKNVKGVSECKISIRMDCRKSWELLTLEKLKVNQLVGDGRSIISRIIELERKSKT